jgi:hypothetical protein
MWLRGPRAVACLTAVGYNRRPEGETGKGERVSQISDGVADLDHVASSQDRLGILLFLIDKKLAQRTHLRHRVFFILTALMLLSLAVLTGFGVSIQRVYFDGSKAVNYEWLKWPWYWTLVAALAPFVMTFMQYLWITFLQMYYGSFRDVTELLQSSDFEEFRPYMHPEVLADDGSFLAVLRSLLAVDIGLTSALFALGGIACALVPPAVQAIASVGVTIVIWRDNVAFALGAAFFYVLFLAMAATKTLSLFATVRRLH